MLGFDYQIGLLGRLVCLRYASEALNRALARLLVQAFDVTRFAHCQRCVDEDFEEPAH